jgi:hypothetical protein
MSFYEPERWIPPDGDLLIAKTANITSGPNPICMIVWLLHV